jgi:hypothetical protein
MHVLHSRLLALVVPLLAFRMQSSQGTLMEPLLVPWPRAGAIAVTLVKDIEK